MNRPESRLGEIPTHLLHFDPKNPRLPSYINGEDETAVLGWMLSDATLLELMGSIAEHGYFKGEPLLVVAKDDDPELGYIVVEGNRRLGAVKLLLNPELAPVRKAAVRVISEEGKAIEELNSLTALIFPARDAILAFLGYRHITGVKQWSSLAKAKYLKQLEEKTPGITHQELAKSIGSRADYVARLLTGLALYDAIEEEAFFNIPGLHEETISFSLLTTAMSYSNIASYLGLDGKDPKLQGLKHEHLKKLTTWLFEPGRNNKPRIIESRNLSKLNAILTSERALEAFEAGGDIEEAFDRVDDPIVVYRKSMNEAKNRLRTANNYLPLLDPLELSVEDLSLAREIFNLIQGIGLLVRKKLESPQEGETAPF